MNEFHQPGTTVCPAAAAMLAATPRGLRNGVRVQDLVNNDGAGFELLRDAARAREVG